MDFNKTLALLEKRKNPEMNPKISAYEALKKYKDDSDIYISFTLLDKIGINPDSSYQTPSGIYCYPLKESWNKLKIYEKKSIGGNFPYVSRYPYIWVLRNKSNSFIDDMASDYSTNDFDNDIKILRDIFYTICTKENINDMFYKLESLKLNNTDKTKSFFSKYDDILNSDTIISKIKNKLTFSVNEFKKELFDTIYFLSIKNRYKLDSISAFYSLTNILAKLISGSSNKSISIKWNWLIRQCGYSGMADKTGQGYIYMTEPIQAVFFTTSAFDVLEKIINKDYDERR